MPIHYRITHPDLRPHVRQIWFGFLILIERIGIVDDAADGD
ncbi:MULTISPECIES: hypothetical protein [Burkholderia]|nr:MULTISPECIES: hypothetical protein [Burkholderia]